MKMYVLSTLSLMLASAGYAAETVNKTLDADAKGDVSVEFVRGRVSVTGWDKNQVQVQGKLDDRSEGLVFEKRGNVIVIEDKTERQLNRGEGSDLTIFVPRRCNLEVGVVSADIMAKDIAGKSELQTVSGDIRAEKLGHVVELQSVSGDINLTGAGRNVSMASVSGDIKAYITAQTIEVEAVSGDINVRNEGELSRGDFTVVSGDVQVESALSDDIDLELESVSGSLVLTARGAVNARINAETGPGGDIVNELTNDVPDEAEFTGAESLEIEVGNGKGRIDASVVTGNIEFRKK